MSKKLLFILLLLVFISVNIFAQAGMGRGRISGKVVDENGNPIEDVIITAQNLSETGTILKGKSNKKGEWAIAGLGTGLWRLTASKDGYAPATLELRVSEFRNPPVNFKLMKLKTGPSMLSTDKEALALFEKADAAVKEGRYDEGISMFNQVLQKYPSLFHIFLNIGYTYMKKDDLDSALKNFQEVLDKLKARDGNFSKEPETAFKAFVGIGEVWIKKGEFEKARENFEEALKLSPKDEALAYSVGEIYFDNQKIDEAIRYYELAITIKTDWWKPHAKLGYCYLNKGNVQKSIEYLKKALELQPDPSEAETIKAIIAQLEKTIKK
ncbi:MAG: tetratricopeptide repeat protein [Candidatus Aminicenantia bacterium]